MTTVSKAVLFGASFLLFFSIALAQVETAQIRLVALDYQPYPAEPGKYVQVWVKIENYGSEDIEDAKIKIFANYPFSLDPGDDGIRELGHLSGGRDVVIDFKVRVDEYALEGEYDDMLYVGWCIQPDCSIVQKEPVEIYIRTPRPYLRITSIEIPDDVKPGNKFSINVTIKNVGDSNLKDILLKFDLDEDFALLNGNEFYIAQLLSGQSAQVNLDFICADDLESGLHKISYAITYYDAADNEFVREEELPVFVSGKPNLLLGFENRQYVVAGQKDIITLFVANAGPQKIKFLSVEILPIENVQLLSPNKIYIGNLDPDDYESLELELIAQKSGQLELPVKIVYADASNKIRVQEEMLEFTALGQPVERKPNYILYALVIILILALGYVLLKKWKIKF